MEVAEMKNRIQNTVDKLPSDRLELALSFLEDLRKSGEEAWLVFLKKKIGSDFQPAVNIVDESDKIKEDCFVRQVNEAFDNPDVADEQHRMAEAVAGHTDVEELPW